MLSRVADAIYWMGRYLERAENVARFVDVNLHLGLDLPHEIDRQWEPLVKTTGDAARFAERYGTASEDYVINFLTFDDTYPNSILSCIASARENARTIREVISSEMWEQINTLYIFVKEGYTAARPIQSAHNFYRRVKMSCHLFWGLTDNTMSHNEAWHFARLGRYIERADKTSRILDIKYFIILPSADEVGTPFDNIQWSALLKSASALEMYRKSWRRITSERVVEFLLLDSEFPRSVRFCIGEADSSIHRITGSPAGAYRLQSERLLGRLKAEFDFARAPEVITAGLHEFLDETQGRLNEVGNRIGQEFFGIIPPQQDQG